MRTLTTTHVFLLISAVILASPIAYTSNYVATNVHTPGLPLIIGDLYGSLLQLCELGYNGGIDCTSIRSEPSLVEALDSLLKQYNVSYRDLMESDISEVAKQISNETWAFTIRDFIEEGNINYHALEDMLYHASNAYLAGEMSHQDYLAILEVLLRISQTYGYTSLVQRISQEQLKVVADLLDRSLYSLPFTVENDATSSPRLPKIDIPSVTPPKWTQSYIPKLETPSWDIVKPLLISIMLVLAFYLLTNIAIVGVERLEGIRFHRIRELEFNRFMTGLSGVLKIYWDSVRFVEKKTGKEMADNLTHREYLQLVERGLGDKAEAFRRITNCYELYKFGGVSHETLLEDAKRSYRELIS